MRIRRKTRRAAQHPVFESEVNYLIFQRYRAGKDNI